MGARWYCCRCKTRQSKKHFEDTIKASSGLSDEKAVRTITEEAFGGSKLLKKLVNFDKNDNEFSLSKEAAHSYRRVLKINGDQSGKFLVDHLIAYAKQRTHYIC